MVITLLLVIVEINAIVIRIILYDTSTTNKSRARVAEHCFIHNYRAVSRTRIREPLCVKQHSRRLIRTRSVCTYV